MASVTTTHGAPSGGRNRTGPSGVDWAPRGVVTPEAVVLEFETAGVGSRLLAKLLDLLIVFVALFLALLALAQFAGDTGEAAAVIIVVVLLFSALFVYPAVAEAFFSGRTLGKAALGLRVLTDEGAPIGFRHAVVRTLVGLVDFWFPPGGAVAVISVLVSPDDQRLGDLAAGTIVLRERAASPPAAAVWFQVPPGYEQWVATLDVTAVDDDDYALVRNFLTRAHTFTPDARWSLSLRLSDLLAAQVRTAPPPGLHPEWFLHSIGAAYQRRHRR